MRGLEGKVIVVAAGGTGATDGTSHGASIGGATARRLAAEGATVVVGDLDEGAARRTVDLIADEGGSRAVAQQFDAADGDSIKALMDRAVTDFGGIDGVHFNAMDMSRSTLGVDGQTTLLDIPLDVWNRTLQVGLTGLLLAARHSIPAMLERGGGSIVATVSGAVYVGEPVRVAYATTKTGMTAVVRHIASAWGRQGIRANAVAPGMVPGDEMVANLDDDGRKRMLKMARSDRLGNAGDIASMVTFLLSDDGSWVTGQILAVDGGVTMRP